MNNPTIHDPIAKVRDDPVNYYRYRIECNNRVQLMTNRGQLSNEITALALVLLRTGISSANRFIDIVHEWREKMSYLFDEFMYNYISLRMTTIILEILDNNYFLL